MKTSNMRMRYGQTLAELGAEDPRIVVLEADLGKSTQSAMFKAQFPERYFEMGIAEADMTAFAAGLALTGKVAFTNSFAVFALGRAYDPVRQDVAYPNLNVKIVGSSAGLSDYGDGTSHQSIDDVALARVLPNLTVLVPGDGEEAARMTRWAARHDGPVYLRICRNDVPAVIPEDADVLEPIVLKEGTDAAVVSMGIMSGKALEAAQALEQEGVSVRVVHVPCLKPLPEAALKQALSGVRAIVTAEEHSVIGGLAQAVAWALRGDGRPLDAVAVMDVFGQSAPDAETLLAHYGLTAGAIRDKVRSLIG